MEKMNRFTVLTWKNKDPEEHLWPVLYIDVKEGKPVVSIKTASIPRLMGPDTTIEKLKALHHDMTPDLDMSEVEIRRVYFAPDLEISRSVKYACRDCATRYKAEGYSRQCPYCKSDNVAPAHIT